MAFMTFIHQLVLLREDSREEKVKAWFCRSLIGSCNQPFDTKRTFRIV
jgi:hypothetical protein